jgi:CheY-like chemotaxis protein
MQNLRDIRRVLFVDDSASFLDMLEKVFRAWNRGSWEFLKAMDLNKALNLMQTHPIHLAVIDLRMPDVDGLQILRIFQKRFPDIPKVVLTGYSNDSSKEESLNNGALLFLEKPHTMEEMESLYHTLTELVNAQPEGGFRGMLWHVHLQEVLQIECLSRNSSVLEISSGRVRGDIYIKNGEIIHADAGEHKGLVALSRLLALRGGEFNLKPLVTTPEVTIGGSWEALLMEAAQFSDEKGTKFWKNGEAEGEGEMFRTLSLPEPDRVVTNGHDTQWLCAKPGSVLEMLDLVRQKIRSLGESLGSAQQLQIVGNGFRIVAQPDETGKLSIHICRDNGADSVKSTPTEAPIAAAGGA